jgi:hypothetical protein
MWRPRFALTVASGLFGLALASGATAASSVRGAGEIEAGRDPAPALGQASESSPETLPVPRARTLPAAGIHATNVVLRGEIHPRSGIAHFRFEYGRSRTYGTRLESSEEVVTGSSRREVAEAITGLRPSTTYHFRIIAFNRFGSVAGGDRTFTTSRHGP